MANAPFSITTEGENALAAATAETVLQLRGTTQGKVKILGWGISFDGISSTEAPVVVRFLRQTSDGTSSGCTEIKWDPDDSTPGCTGFRGFSSTEPTAGDVLETHEVHPQGGNLVREYPPGREPLLDDAATSRIAIECNAPAAVNCVAFLIWQE